MSNFWNMGSRRICGGTYRRIFSFGAMEVTDCHSERLLNFGSMRMENCQVEKASSRGALHCHSTTFQRLHSIGCLQTTGVCQCEELRLSGSGQFAFLDCESIVLTAGSRQERAVVEGNISAKTALILLPIEIHDGFDAHTWITGAPVSFHTVACESFYGMSSICADEVNAEQVYLLAYPDTQISMITGTSITVSPHAPKDSSDMIPRIDVARNLRRFQPSQTGLIHVGTIEGDTLLLSHTHAKSVQGQDVQIGELCIIDQVIYSHSVRISPKAIVHEVVQL